MSFKVGDVVRKRTGGPWMDVEEVSVVHVVCSWRDAKGVHKETFRAATLVGKSETTTQRRTFSRSPSKNYFG